MKTAVLDNVSIKSMGDYFIFKIPKNLISLDFGSFMKNKLTVEDQLLALFSQGKKDYQEGKLKELKSLSDLM